ncbi:hypothetical protein AB6A40_005792 [Gnathostoma spinigerum]|uniref:Uncharacterized protein n=1 Tax=Gnathostoma spinigerum TaxID=75299 RepID=A0ABD6EGM6_9BILA
MKQAASNADTWDLVEMDMEQMHIVCGDPTDLNVFGPLPPNWEVAYSERGEKYFIDHNNGTTQWNDPRALPEGWEKVEDSVYGTFYVDHINKRTQYEKPSTSGQVNNKMSNTAPSYGLVLPGDINSNGQCGTNGFDKPCGISYDETVDTAACQSFPHTAGWRDPVCHSNSGTSSTHHPPLPLMFTRDPSQLRGELITTRFIKGSKGLGFTLIGSDGNSMHEEFLQVKSIIPGGPAHRDNVLRTGDVLVYVNDECVLGATQSHACHIFQKINVGEEVQLQICRGYPLLINPSNKIVTENAYTAQSHEEREVIISKGEDGFGFTIFESFNGQRVKKILHPDRCENLMEGDALLEMKTTYPQGTPNSPVGPERVTNFRTMSHHELVTFLRECPVGFWAKLTVLRHLPRYRSRTPSAAFRYGEQRTTPIPLISPRSRTPAPQPPRPSKKNTTQLSLPSLSNVRNQRTDNVDSGAGIYIPSNTLPRQAERHSHDSIYENLSRVHPSSTSLGFATPSYVPVCAYFNEPTEVITVNLLRKPAGFGFRVVGGTEEGTCVSVGQVVPGGAAAEDNRLKQGDEIIEIDGQNVIGESHENVVNLMHRSAANGRVRLVVRRRRPVSMYATNDHLRYVLPTHDIVLTRTDHDGFGFVIVSSAHRNECRIGRILENSPAALCGQLHVDDRVVAVNGVGISNLSHSDIVNLIKDSGLSVRLTIVPLSTLPFVTVDRPEPGQPHECSNEIPAVISNGYSQLSSSTTPYWHFGQNDAQPKAFSPALTPESVSLMISVELTRGPRGFGFSIRGGQEFDSMPLFVLRIADDGPAAIDGRLRIGDQLVEINGHSTKGMTHANAIQLIKQSSTVHLIVSRTRSP